VIVLLCELLDAGMTVLTVIATDVDNGNNGSVTYSLKQVPRKAGQPLFSVDPHMGLITTRLTNALDREVQPIYHVVVLARDRGSPPMSGQSAPNYYVLIATYCIGLSALSAFRAKKTHSHPYSVTSFALCLFPIAKDVLLLQKQ